MDPLYDARADERVAWLYWKGGNRQVFIWRYATAADSIGSANTTATR
jgi:hypothetical protein